MSLLAVSQVNAATINDAFGVIKDDATKKYGTPNYSQINNVTFTDNEKRSKTVTINCSQNVLTFILNDVNSGLQF